jgi:hypothetical protein
MHRELRDGIVIKVEGQDQWLTLIQNASRKDGNSN